MLICSSREAFIRNGVDVMSELPSLTTNDPGRFSSSFSRIKNQRCSVREGLRGPNRRQTRLPRARPQRLGLETQQALLPPNRLRRASPRRCEASPACPVEQARRRKWRHHERFDLAVPLLRNVPFAVDQTERLLSSCTSLTTPSRRNHTTSTAPPKGSIARAVCIRSCQGYRRWDPELPTLIV